MQQDLFARFQDPGQVPFGRRLKRLSAALTDNDLAAAWQPGAVRTDPLPVIIQPADWSVLSAGLSQRIRLFEALAVDLYGEQSLCRRGLLPASLLFSNPDFLQVACNARPSGGRFIHLSACDVIRGPDGGFRVVGDRLQVAEGLGRAVENRLGVSRAFPELFRSLNTERLAGFFAHLLRDLSSLCVSGGGSVLLASPPDSPTRGEDAILSRYLGLPLVENDDLAVRGMEIYLKTLGGLRRIGAILRRVPDAMCDPLELRIDSGEGAVGLISSVREGNVGLANFLGVGVLESGLFKPFLPRLCRELLGEEQLLADVRTVWLGDPAQAEEVLDNPEAWYFRRTFGDRALVRYDRLTPTGQLSFLRRLESEPAAWTAEENVVLSRDPVWSGDGWSDAAVKCRFFALNGADGVQVMPGGYGLYECASEPGRPGRVGEKDVWVLSEGVVEPVSLLAAADEPIEPTRAGGDLPSRAAQHLARLGRALAAANLMARLARGVAVRLSDESWTECAELPALLRALAGGATGTREDADPESLLSMFVLRQDCRHGLQPQIREIRDLALQVRDRVSEELWSHLQAFAGMELPEDSAPAALLPYLDRVLSDSSSVAGLCAESMTRGHEWRFQEIGRRLEHAALTMGVVRCLMGESRSQPSAEAAVIAALLEVGDGTMTYRRRYGGRLQAAPALDLLLCDESNPRSVAYQVVRLREENRHLPQHAESDSLFSPLDRALMRLLTDLRLAEASELARTAADGRRGALLALLDAAEAGVAKVDDLLSRAYLDHAPKAGVVHALVTEV